jgi:hypothetical protein
VFDDPSVLVNEFIADYFRWNAAAHQRMEELPPKHSDEVWLEAATLAKQEYADLILKKYCRPGFEGEGTAWGSDPLHDPSCETIGSVKPRGKRCVIQTTMVRIDKIGKERVTNFEYHLSREDDRWSLESVKVVMKDGKYDSL